MTYQLTVSPDFSPRYLAGWYIFNTWLQKALGEAIHLELYDSFQSQREAIVSGGVDIIYANPYDAALLVREQGFMPVACAAGSADEAIIVVPEGSSVQSVEDLEEGCRVASTDDPDVHLMGMIMLEPADLSADNTVREICDSYVLVAKSLLNGKCDVGFFLDKSYDELSNMISSQLRPLVRSEIQAIHHCLMVGPGLVDRLEELQNALAMMTESDKGRGVLAELNMQSWRAMDQEEMEFLIDLISTLES